MIRIQMINDQFPGYQSAPVFVTGFIRKDMDQVISQHFFQFIVKDYVCAGLVSKNQFVIIELIFLLQHPENRYKRGNPCPTSNKQPLSTVLDSSEYFIK